MRNIIIGGAVILVLAAGGFFFLQNQGTLSPDAENNTASNNSSSSQENGSMGGQVKGKVYFAVTDAAADIENVNEITMTVDRVEMHSAAQGWTTVSTETKEFDLLELKATGNLEFLAEADVAVDTYNQVRLSVSHIYVDTKSGAEVEAKLPSNKLRINTSVVVEEGAESSVALDFKADKSLHITGNGTYIFTPVVQVESRSSANVEVAADGIVSVSGGNVDANIEVGTDIDGETQANFQLDQNTELEVDTEGIINIKGQGKAKGQGAIDLGL